MRLLADFNYSFMTIRINLKLYASLSEYLPAGTENNTIVAEIPADASPYEVIDRFRVPRDQAHLILLNGVYVSPEDRDKTTFKEGDILAIWPPVAGG